MEQIPLSPDEGVGEAAEQAVDYRAELDDMAPVMEQILTSPVTEGTLDIADVVDVQLTHPAFDDLEARAERAAIRSDLGGLYAERAENISGNELGIRLSQQEYLERARDLKVSALGDLTVLYRNGLLDEDGQADMRGKWSEVAALNRQMGNFSEAKIESRWAGEGWSQRVRAVGERALHQIVGR